MMTMEARQPPKSPTSMVKGENRVEIHMAASLPATMQ